MKFELNQIIHYMRNNKPHSAPVLARMQVENLKESWAHTSEQKDLYTPFGPAGVFYKTCHGTIQETEAYASKQEMLTSLLAE